MIDCFSSCFRFNPNNRPTAVHLLCHPFASDFHNEEEEPIFPHGPIKLRFGDNTKLTAREYRDSLYVEVASRRRDIAPRHPGAQDAMSCSGSV